MNFPVGKVWEITRKSQVYVIALRNVNFPGHYHNIVFIPTLVLDHWSRNTWNLSIKWLNWEFAVGIRPNYLETDNEN